MNDQAKPLIFDSVAAIHTGGSYIVGADGKAVRDDANSGPLPGAAAPQAATLADAAPGAAAELKAAAGGVPQASAEASAPVAATKAKA